MGLYPLFAYLSKLCIAGDVGPKLLKRNTKCEIFGSAVSILILRETKTVHHEPSVEGNGSPKKAIKCLNV